MLQQLQKESSFGIGSKYFCPGIAARTDMIDRIFKLDPKWSRHKFSLPKFFC